MTIDDLVTRPHDRSGEQTARLEGVERTKYVLKEVTVVEAKVEADQDMQLVIRDDHNPPTDSMIVEFPNRDCNVDAPAAYAKVIREARADVVDFVRACRTGSKQGWVQLHGTATTRAAGLFNLLHGSSQHGVGGNEVELDPALGFRGSCG